MRIITGKAKGIKLTTLEGEATRPTSERVKEAVFSMIQFNIEGRRVLDLFAGSGQMGLEAISRGAESAVLVDRSKQAIKIINDNITKTRFNNEVTAFNCDYIEFLRSYIGPRFDIVFLDPPYRSGFYVTALDVLFKHELLKPTSLIVCESSDDNAFYDTDIIKEQYKVIKQNGYSRSLITILSPLKQVSKRSQSMKEKKIAIVPGSFDPITYGHIDIVKRAAKDYDLVYLAVMINSNKKYLFSLDERKRIAESALGDISNVKVISSEGMLWQLAYDLNANAIVKGYRNQIDYDYELSMAKFNSEHNPNAPTILLKADPELEALSSTVVRGRIEEGSSLFGLLPEKTVKLINEILIKK